MAAAVPEPIARAPTIPIEHFLKILLFQPQDPSMVVKTTALSPPLVSKPFSCPWERGIGKIFAVHLKKS
jgi:hypothetical protein